ncbi:MAG: hypothetical protein K9J80_17265 [Sulfuritalea sp.]|nr:hypothetical protein [Sulfuritalea sp.]
MALRQEIDAHVVGEEGHHKFDAVTDGSRPFGIRLGVLLFIQEIVDFLLGAGQRTLHLH